MIHEYALDPDIVNDWQVFKYIIDQCGMPNGRLISNFPSDWPKVAIHLCQIQGPKRTAVVERLRGLKHKLGSTKRIYDNEQPWIDNAVTQCNFKPFHAIIARQNPNKIEHVLVADEIEENTPLWKVNRGAVILRTAEDIARCALSLIDNSKDVLFIDPHIDFVDKDGKENDRFYKTIKLLIEQTFQNKWPRRLELHLKHKQDRQNDNDSWRGLCVAKLAPLIPKTFKMKVFAWKRKWDGDDMHARYILTERGGIKYDAGLDEGWVGKTTDVDLMDGEPYKKRWHDFQERTAALKPAIRFDVEGIRESNNRP